MERQRESASARECERGSTEWGDSIPTQARVSRWSRGAQAWDGEPPSTLVIPSSGDLSW